MGRYYNPADATSIQSTGARHLIIGSHAFLIGQLQPNESLGLHLDRGIFKQMPDVTRGSEFDEFNKQIESGTVKFIGIYAVPSDDPGWGG